jgi:hypothetical protein
MYIWDINKRFITISTVRINEIFWPLVPTPLQGTGWNTKMVHKFRIRHLYIFSRHTEFLHMVKKISVTDTHIWNAQLWARLKTFKDKSVQMGHYELERAPFDCFKFERSENNVPTWCILSLSLSLCLSISRVVYQKRLPIQAKLLQAETE